MGSCYLPPLGWEEGTLEKGPPKIAMILKGYSYCQTGKVKGRGKEMLSLYPNPPGSLESPADAVPGPIRAEDSVCVCQVEKTQPWLPGHSNA